MTKKDRIVHICSKEDAEKALNAGVYAPQSLADEGFIHASLREQVVKVANAFYPGLTNLVLLWIDTDRLGADVVWENVEGVVFPHIYGSVNMDAVVRVTDFLPDEDGVFRNLPA